MDELGPVVGDTLAGESLVYGNEGGAGFGYAPAQIEVTASRPALEDRYGAGARLLLEGPTGWTIAREEGGGEAIRWRVRPVGEPPSCLVNLRLIVERADGGESEIVHGLPIEIRGRSQFDPVRHGLPFANAAGDFGAVLPSRATFQATYRRGALAETFFRGLYSRVVFLADGREGALGGLCTGIARSALERSLEQPESSARDEDPAALRQAAQLWHGRQLADQALLASAAAWMTQGSRAAYAIFRRDLLGRGVTEVALDLHVPRPWRRDLLTAFVGSGHTVVPYALRQASDDRAEVWVYDPNYPSAVGDESVIHFDLARDSYRYRHYDGRAPDRPSKVIAVHQEHYRRARTGYLGGLLSLLLYRPERRSRVPAAPLVGATALLLAGVLGVWLGRRRLA